MKGVVTGMLQSYENLQNQRQYYDRILKHFICDIMYKKRVYKVGELKHFHPNLLPEISLLLFAQ